MRSLVTIDDSQSPIAIVQCRAFMVTDQEFGNATRLERFFDETRTL
jgi:hypothetical protein